MLLLLYILTENFKSHSLENITISPFAIEKEFKYCALFYGIYTL